MSIGRLYESLILGGISVTILTMCFLLVFAGIRFTIMWCRQHPLRKPPCQHELIVCDYKWICDNYDMKDLYYVACTKCNDTNWVEESYLKGMYDLGLYKGRDNND